MMNALDRRLLTILSLIVLCLAGGFAADARAESPDTRQLLERYIAVWNGADIDELDSLLTPDFVHQSGGGSPHTSIEAMKRRILNSRENDGGLRYEVHDIIAGPDRGAMRFTIHGVFQPTDNPYAYINLAMYRFVDGRIAEERVQGDAISFQADLGYRIVPPGYTAIAPPVENAELDAVPASFPSESRLRSRLAEMSSTASNKAARVVIETDVACILRLDGEELGWLWADSSVELRLEPGAHALQAMSAGRGIFHQEALDLRKRDERTISIRSPGRMIAHPRYGVSEDLTTGLMWPLQDSGQGFSWAGAKEYCSNLELGGYDDWRLPTIFELDAIYVPDSPRDFRTVNGVSLSECCPWSSNEQGEHMAWIYVFYKGARFLQHKIFSGERLLALCVRDAVERRGEGATSARIGLVAD